VQAPIAITPANTNIRMPQFSPNISTGIDSIERELLGEVRGDITHWN